MYSKVVFCNSTGLDFSDLKACKGVYLCYDHISYYFNLLIFTNQDFETCLINPRSGKNTTKYLCPRQ